MNLKLKHVIMKFQKLYTKLQTATHLTINFVIWPSLTKLLSIWVFNILIWVSLEKSSLFFFQLSLAQVGKRLRFSTLHPELEKLNF
jgi:hypothetical protein